LADSHGNHHLLALKRRRIDEQSAELHLVQPPLHQLLQLPAAGFDEVLAHGALLQPVRFGELPYRVAVIARAQPQHELLPHGLGQRFSAMEQFVAAQSDFVVIRGSHAGPLDRHLLPHHHAVTTLLAPAVRPSLGIRLAPVADQ
jgi:hypothetical protein